MSHVTSAWPAAAAIASTKAPAAPYADGQLTVERHDGAEAYGALRSEWLSLMARMARPTVFQEPDFLSLWAESFAAGKAAARLRTLLVRRGDRAELIWPLMIERRGAVAVARAAGTPIGQYDDVVLAPGPDDQAAAVSASSATANRTSPSSASWRARRRWWRCTRGLTAAMKASKPSAG
ncbi:MAG TPA: hypothetical protein VHG92_02615, partial [Afifellaceae bacterium]|nr:hypothetical protein [Afifellaceae bacterium]